VHLNGFLQWCSAQQTPEFDSKNEFIAYCKIGLITRKMHYPPETASVMLIAQMIATVLQVSIFMEIISYMYFECLFGLQLITCRYKCMSWWASERGHVCM